MILYGCNLFSWKYNRTFSLLTTVAISFFFKITDACSKIIRLKIDIYLMEPNSFPIATDKIKKFIYITIQAVSFGIVLADFCL